MSETDRYRGLKKGSEPKDASGAQVVSSVMLCPAEREYLRDTYGSINAGLRRLLLQDMALNVKPKRKKKS